MAGIYIWRSRRRGTRGIDKYNYRIDGDRVVQGENGYVQETGLPEEIFMEKFLSALGQANMPSLRQTSRQPPPDYKPEKGERTSHVTKTEMMLLLRKYQEERH